MFGKIPKKSWLAIIEHAKSCVVDDYKLYRYLISGQIMLIFNAVYKLVGVTFDEQTVVKTFSTITKFRTTELQIVLSVGSDAVLGMEQVVKNHIERITQPVGQFGNVY
jgi:hypothetical protein